MPGYLLASVSLANPTPTTLLGGTAYISAASGNYSAVASNATTNGVTGGAYIKVGTLDVITWLKARFPRDFATVNTPAHNRVLQFPQCD